MDIFEKTVAKRKSILQAYYTLICALFGTALVKAGLKFYFKQKN